jgi:hypothetical protein
MRDKADDLPPGLLDRLVRAYLRMLGRPDRPKVPSEAELDGIELDPSPPTPEERAAAEAAARAAMQRLRE